MGTFDGSCRPRHATAWGTLKPQSSDQLGVISNNLHGSRRDLPASLLELRGVVVVSALRGPRVSVEILLGAIHLDYPYTVLEEGGVIFSMAL